jgi:hypothetical protein
MGVGILEHSAMVFLAPFTDPYGTLMLGVLMPVMVSVPPQLSR